MHRGCLGERTPAGQAKRAGCATRVSWSPLSGLKGVQPPLQFGARTRDCSPGHAGIEGPQLARTGASHWARLAQARAASRPGLCAIGKTERSGGQDLVHWIAVQRERKSIVKKNLRGYDKENEDNEEWISKKRFEV